VARVLLYIVTSVMRYFTYNTLTRPFHPAATKCQVELITMFTFALEYSTINCAVLSTAQITVFKLTYLIEILFSLLLC
jgi:hypothetical protein